MRFFTWDFPYTRLERDCSKVTGKSVKFRMGMADISFRKERTSEGRLPCQGLESMYVMRPKVLLASKIYPSQRRSEDHAITDGASAPIVDIQPTGTRYIDVPCMISETSPQITQSIWSSPFRSIAAHIAEGISMPTSVIWPIRTANTREGLSLPKTPSCLLYKGLRILSKSLF